MTKIINQHFHYSMVTSVQKGVYDMALVMKANSGKLAMALFIMIVLLTQVLPVAAHAKRLVLTGMTITNSAPININCGQTVTLNCSVSYMIDNGVVTWGNSWVTTLPKTITAQLYDDDGWFGNELYNQTTVTIPNGPAGTTGTIPFTMTTLCTWDEDCDDCEVNGDENEAELFIAFWKQFNGFGSTVKKAKCVCDDCETSNMRMNDFDSKRSMVATTALTLDSTLVSISSFDITISFDALTFESPAVTFADPVIQTNAVVTPLANGINFSADFDPPYDLMAGEFGTLELDVAALAPIGETEVGFVDSICTFITGDTSLSICLPDAKAGILPIDEEAPVINEDSIVFDVCSLYGNPGSIFDPYLDSIPGYVTVTAIYESEQTEPRLVEDDGSFSFPNILLPPGSMVKLVVTDANDNSTSIWLGPAGPCTGAIPTLTEWGMIIFCVLLFGWMAWVIVRRRRRATVSI
jgi:hypothetical protein